MHIQTENGDQFDTRAECLEWINCRVVRFKLRMVKVGSPDSAVSETYVPQKCQGKILDTLAEGFVPGGIDEPLKIYAEPIKQDGKWLAVMSLQ